MIKSTDLLPITFCLSGLDDLASLEQALGVEPGELSKHGALIHTLLQAKDADLGKEKKDEAGTFTTVAIWPCLVVEEGGL